MEYIKATCMVAKPFITYLGIKSSFLITTYSAEWYSGRIYSKYCIGEGFDGYYNHVWNIASPSCTGLLFSHISLLGVFIASIGITFISGFIFMYNNYMKDDYIKTKKIIKELKEEFNN